MDDKSRVEAFYNRYKKAGFFFPASILTTYTLSLSTKPFVILSGISGTGKTKIAQLFSVPGENDIEVEKDKKLPSLAIKITEDFGRFNFPQDALSELLTEQEELEFNKSAEEFRKMDNEGNFTKTYILDIEDEFGSFKIGFYGQRASSPLVRVRFYKSRRDKTSPEYDARKHLKKYYKPGDILKLQKIGDKKFKVVSVNDQEIIKKVREYESATIERTCFISVRSNWTDSSELFGFYNLIEQVYHIPKFLSFLLKARNNPEYPFFVLLDEMNLSKVEHYFSDILSCMESRVMEKEEIKQEKVILHNGLEQLMTDSEDFEYIPNEIEIPLNLYFTGTVNIDESTYMFSHKVLDRANVIEFNEVDLESYGTGEYPDENDYKLSKFPDFTKITLAQSHHFKQLPDNIKNILTSLNNILKKHNLHFGYRTVNEISLYILNAKNFVEETEKLEMKALDYQLVQKVFPKLNGSYAMLEEPLREVLLFLSNSQEADMQKIKASKTDFPQTVNKLQRMYDKLSKNGFATFIE